MRTQGSAPGPAVVAAFVGPAIPDTPAFRTPAFSPAGSRFTISLLTAFRRVEHPVTAVIAFEPVLAFPRSRRFWSRGCRVPLGPGPDADFVPYLNVTPVKQLCIGMGTWLKLIAWAWRMRACRHRLIYTYNLSVPPGVFTWLAAKVTGSKAVAILCDIDVPGQTVPDTLWHRFDFWMQKRLIPVFDGVVSIADAIIEDFAPGRGYLRVEGGVSQEVFDRTAGRRGRAPSSPFTFFAAGTLDRANGIEMMLAALASLPENGLRLRIAGRGPLEGAVREAARRDSRIEFVGFLPFDQVAGLYRDADVLLNIRLTKAVNTRYVFPSKLMEYLASGTPVISTCPGAVAEEFQALAYLLNDETPEALARLMKHVADLDPDSREATGRRARAHMAEHKTWDAQARRIAAYACRLFESGPVPTGEPL